MMNSAAIQSLQNQCVSNPIALTDEQIQNLIPRGLVSSPTNPYVSKRYVFASTSNVIEDMKKLGWDVISAAQTRTRSAIRSYHRVSFQNSNIKITKVVDGVKEVVCYPRIILTNSHDGFNAFHFMIGLYQVRTGSTLIMQTKDCADIVIRHVAYTFDQLRQAVQTITNQVIEQAQFMNLMQSVTLNKDLQKEFALNSIRIRQNDPEVICLDEDLEDLISGSESDSLWDVFNNIQQKLMSGNFYMIGKNGKARKARRITSIMKDISFNKQLFSEAASYVMG